MQFLSIAALAIAASAQNLQQCADYTGVFTPSSIVVNPFPVTPGQTASIKAIGVASAPITEGTMVEISLKKGTAVVFRNSVDFCEASAAVGFPCPRPAGDSVILAQIVVPPAAPEGTFEMDIDVTDAEGNPVACFVGPVVLKK
ncbi:Phosphatidylglycerol/phosphatidylinositol transfer protein [Globomyces sp. JEL0801]|nr:Phosphatidylglycerol/phosphatidylinositol transfer protein [Globomyces sp. JEL0801]